MNTSEMTIIIGIVSVTILESIALLRGIDGVALSASIGAIAYMAGLLTGRKLKVRLETEE